MSKYRDNDTRGMNKEERLLFKMRERFKQAMEYYTTERVQWKEDIDFYAGDQWPDDLKQERENNNLPCLTVNKLKQFVKQVCNDQMRNRPGIQVNPASDDASVEASQAIQALIRKIEYDSDADCAYDNAFQQAAISGLGWFRIIPKDEGPNSFNQVLAIEPIYDVFSVLMDPQAKQAYYEDADYAFVFTKMQKDDFADLYPNAECVSAGWMYPSDTTNGWIETDTIRIAEYFYSEYKSDEIVQLSDGNILTTKEWKEFVEKAQQDPSIDIPTILSKKVRRERKICWVKTNGFEILEETTWPGQFIPLVPVFADRYIQNGKFVFEGVVRNAKDTQRRINYFTSQATQSIALAPIPPWVGVAGQFEGQEQKWKESNRKPFPFLEYNPIGSDGSLAPPPVRNAIEPPVQAIMGSIANATQELKETTGIYDPSLGIASSPQESGVAVLARQAQSDLTNFHYVDNLCKSVRYCGKIIIDVLPVYYDVGRSVKIEDPMNPRTVQVGSNVPNDPDNGSIKLGVGQFNIEVSAGESNTTQRQQSLKILSDLATVQPQIAAVCGDLIVKNLDIPESEQMAQRLFRMVPDQAKDDNGVSPAVQAQIQQAQQQFQIQLQTKETQIEQMFSLISQIASALNDAVNRLNNKEMDISSKERIALEGNKADLLKEIIKQNGTANNKILAAELEGINNRLVTLGNNVSIEESSGKNDFDQYIIPGVNDPVTRMQNNQADQQAKDIATQGLQQNNGPQVATPVSQPEIKGKGPSALAARIQNLNERQ